jgi:hypothetical protein
MTKNKEEVNKDLKYNKKRKPIFRVEATTADTEEAAAEMDQMKVDLINHSGTAKKALLICTDLPKKTASSSKKTCNSRVHEYSIWYRKQTNLVKQGIKLCQ